MRSRALWIVLPLLLAIAGIEAELLTLPNRGQTVPVGLRNHLRSADRRRDRESASAAMTGR
jgi:hypothetical protein